MQEESADPRSFSAFQVPTSDGSDAANLDAAVATYTATSSAGDAKLPAVKVIRARTRYVRLRITRGTVPPLQSARESFPEPVQTDGGNRHKEDLPMQRAW